MSIDARPFPSLPRRLAVSVFLLAVYQLGRYLPVPGVATELAFDSAIAPISSLDIFTLGLGPFLASFIVVELYSLLTSWGRRWRQDGLPGRRKLNRAAIRLGLVIALVQALALFMNLERAAAAYGLAVIPDPGWVTGTLFIGTLTAGSAMALAIALLINENGLGNGICLLVISDLLVSDPRIV